MIEMKIANLFASSVAIRGPGLVGDFQGSRIREDINYLNSKIDNKLEDFIPSILERIDKLEKLISQSNERISGRDVYSEPPTMAVLDDEVRLREFAGRTISSARIVIRSRLTATGGSLHLSPSYSELKAQDPTGSVSVMNEGRPQRMTHWGAGLESLKERSKASNGLEYSNWTSQTRDADSEDEINDDLFIALADEGERHYKKGEIAEAFNTFKVAFTLVNPSNLQLNSVQKYNDILLILASIYSEQTKFFDAKEALMELISVQTFEISPWEVQHKIKGTYLLAKVLFELDEFKEALKICKEAMRVRKHNLGRDSPEYQESLELWLLIAKAQGANQPVTTFSATDSRDGDGRSSVLGRLVRSYRSPPYTYMFEAAATQKSQSRIFSDNLDSRDDTNTVMINTAEDGESNAPIQTFGDSDMNVEDDTESLGHVGNDSQILPEQPSGDGPLGMTTPPASPDRSELEQGLSLLETNEEYKFLLEDFNPQVALVTAVNKGHPDVVWTLLNKLSEVGQKFQENLRHDHRDQIVEKPEIFSSKLDLDYTDDKGPLIFQALWPDTRSSNSSQRCQIAKMLLEAGSDPDISWLGLTPLLKASHGMQWEFVNILLAYALDVNQTDENNRTALHFVLECSDPDAEDIVCQLVGRGASLDIHLSKDGVKGPITALTYVVLHGWKKATKAFLSHGAHTERISDTYFDSPLGAAVSKGYGSITKTLLRAAANIEGRSYYNNTFASPLWIATRAKNIDIVRLLLSRKADVEAEDTENGNTPLLIATSKGYEDIMKLFFEHKANINAKNKNSETALWLACTSGKSNMVQMLLEHGAEVDSQCVKKATPLSVAATLAHSEVIATLLKANATVDVPDQNGLTALHNATCDNQVRIVEQLLEHGANIEAASADGYRPLHIAARMGHLAVVNLLLVNKAEIEAQNNDQSTPLHLATQHGYVEVVRALIKFSANIEAENIHECRPLHFACEKGHDSVVQLLLEAGAEIEATELNGFSAFYEAARHGHLRCVELLHERGAKIDLKGYRSITPLIAAAKHNHISVVKFLLEKGVDVNAVTNGAESFEDDGWNALQYAMDYKREKIEQMLRAAGAVDTLAKTEGDFEEVSKLDFQDMRVS